MTANDVLYRIQRTDDEVKSSDGKIGLRYRDGKFQVLCETCAIVKWVPVADEYAMQTAERLLKN